MDSSYKLEQDVLRDSIIQEVQHYINSAEDVHFDDLIVNEKTLAVDMYYRNGIRPKGDDWEYYSVLDLIKRKGLWFEVDKDAIEAVVQEHLPNPEVKEFVDAAIESIRNFVCTEKPASLRSCMMSATYGKLMIDCYDSTNVETEEADDTVIVDDLDEYYSFKEYQLSRIVRHPNADTYKISGYELTKAALDYFNS